MKYVVIGSLLPPVLLGGYFLYSESAKASGREEFLMYVCLKLSLLLVSQEQ